MALHFREEAEKDLAASAHWYEEQLTGLGDDFLDEVQGVLNVIAQTPLLYPKIHGNIRRGPLKRFPFALQYKVEDIDVVIIAVTHGKRDPESWKTRE